MGAAMLLTRKETRRERKKMEERREERTETWGGEREGRRVWEKVRAERECRKAEAENSDMGWKLTIFSY